MSDKSKVGVFSEEEKAAMRERAKELKEEAKMLKNREVGEKAVMDAIKVMNDSDKTIAIKIHELVNKYAPNLMPKTWYGMPAYTNKEGKVVCFFQAAGKFGYRYATLGFQEDAHLDDGNMWPASFAVLKISSKEEAQIIELIKRSIS